MFRWLNSQTLKAKLCVLTFLLVVAVMLFVGYIVIEQQRKSLMLQMEGMGRFLVKNLAKNVVSPLLQEDSLSLNNLISSLEARDKLEGNPARFTVEEYQNFLAQFFLKDQISLLDQHIEKQDKIIYLHVNFSRDSTELISIAKNVIQKVLTLWQDMQTPQQYEEFFAQYPWTRIIAETLPVGENKLPQLQITSAQQQELTAKVAERIFNEISGYVKNPVIGYAIVLDKENIIRAHPDINLLGQPYALPQGTELLEKGDEVTIHRLMFKGESHFDFESPIQVRDKNLGAAKIGTVHIGFREENLVKDIASAKQKILYITIIAVILGSLGAYGLASLIVKPIKVLVHDAEILGGGDLTHKITVMTGDEVGMLATTLDDTRVKLKEAQAQLVVNERLARELEIAREIQMGLLPKETPTLGPIELGTLYRAASQVGGDLYDFFWVSEDELGIVVADVSGKGVPGSLVMTMAKAVIRAKAMKSDAPTHKLPAALGGGPASVIRKTNQMIAQDIKKGMFITANYGILNVKTLRFIFVSAGHNDTLVYNSQTQELRSYNPKGIALGLDKGLVFDSMLQEQEISLSSGDLIIQFTDGITEAMNEEREEFGDDRLKEMIRKYAHLKVNDFLIELDKEIRNFTRGFTQSDDITAVVIKVK
ncbi:stage II sporulation E family protein [Candidatus Moduliflexus flocculans]|uniref:Stage II sporulation E family protein n=1 Tax=Candidatus Moduliflexus flocculans TaxID=1499966 RepID=A0A081BTL7_9BACT|nr:stage II sporulation E family protein [Candidatus Moduliflexus flocculans]